MLNLRKRVQQWLGSAFWLPSWLRVLFQTLTASKEHFEVERKYRISTEERAELPGKLLSMGFKFVGSATEFDQFLPTEVEGDMCRIREETLNGETKNYLTVKTWTHVDGEKERQEKEEEIPPLVKETMLDLGIRLNRGPLLNFSKDRDFYSRSGKDNRKVVIVLDLTHGLGEFDGPYMEIEILAARKTDVAEARSDIQILAQEVLGEARDPWQRSYLEMLKQSNKV